LNVIVNKHELIKDHVHRDLLEILEAGVKAANPQDSVVEALRLVDGDLCIYDACYPIRGSIHVVGFGKASVNMALGVLKVLGDLIVGGVVITTEGVNVDYVGRVKVFAGEHPIPGEGTLKASDELLKYLSSEVKNNDLVIVLISGGGSALFEVPHPPLDLKDIAETTSLLMKSGADIVELNTVRKHLSRVKGGRLLEYLSKADKVISLIVSDVVGDEIQYIASGPTTYDTTTYRDSIDVLKRRGVWDLIPEKVRRFLLAGARGEIPETVKPGDPLLDKVRNFIIASNRKSLDAMALKARDLGYSPTILTPFMEGEAREVGRFLASVAKYIAIKERNVKIALLLSGETTMTLSPLLNAGFHCWVLSDTPP